MSYQPSLGEQVAVVRHGFVDEVGEGAVAMGQWLAEGKLVFDEQIDEGIENALPAFLRLFDGSNDGKMILKISGDEA